MAEPLSPKEAMLERRQQDLYVEEKGSRRRVGHHRLRPGWAQRWCRRGEEVGDGVWRALLPTSARVLPAT